MMLGTMLKCVRQMQILQDGSESFFERSAIRKTTLLCSKMRGNRASRVAEMCSDSAKCAVTAHLGLQKGAVAAQDAR